MNVPHLKEQYERALTEDILPFWLRYSIDAEAGGFFTCLGRNGAAYDTDKFVWLQARQVWLFARLYNDYRPEHQWLQTARHGAAFLQRYGRAENGDWYFSLDRYGRPLVQPYNVFSDCFACMAFGQLYRATQHDYHAEVATTTFHRILERRDSPKGKYEKSVPGTRPLKNFALPMILCNLCLEIESLLPKELVERTIEECIHEVMEVFYDPDSGLILENVAPDGTPVDSFEGRLLNPGHAIEAMWFIMDLGRRRNDRALINRAVAIALRTLDLGWDQRYGGIFYFLDRKGHPPQQLEWDQKLWWVHLETLVALLKGYVLTGNTECRDWFARVHAYTWSQFPDPEHGEWYGYLNRRGEVLLPLKGGKWKGCFHVPRGIYLAWRELARMSS